MKVDKSIIKKIKPWMFLASFCAVLIFGLMNSTMLINNTKYFAGLFISLLYGIVIAFILNIPMSYFEALFKEYISEKSFFYKRIRGISILLTLVLAFLVLSILLSIIIPQVINSVILLLNNIVVYINNIIAFVNDILVTLSFEEMDINIDSKQLDLFVDTITKNWETILQNASNVVSDAGTFVLNNAVAFTVALGNWFMGFMLSLYLLHSKELFINQMKTALAALLDKDSTNRILRISTKTNEIFTSFISGQLLEACILGCLIYVGMVIFDFAPSFQVLIAVVTSITSIIPMFGAMIAMLFGFILILATDPVQAIWFIIFYQVVQQFEGTVIYPRVVGNSVGLPGVWVLLSIVVFTGLFGLAGALVAVPTTAVIYSIMSDVVHNRIKNKNIEIIDNQVVDIVE